MKTGIITLIGNNYGNRLQNYAVQELLSKYGETYTVKYDKKNMSSKNDRAKLYSPKYIENAINSRLLNIYHISNRKMNFLTRILFFVNHKKDIEAIMINRDKAFENFDNKYIKYEKNKLHLSGDDNENWVKSYNAWVCGSDQIWNPTYPAATRNAFLQFAPQERRIAFSASIGLEDVEDMPNEYKTWIDEIPYLSVREEAAANIVKHLTGKDAKVFLDPTMILPKEKWVKMANEAKRKLPNNFALNYFLGIKEKEYVKFIDSDIKKKNLDRVDLLNGEYLDYFDLAPDDVVKAVRNSQIVYTDSFHGVVFSIIFHKPFIVFERKEEGKSMNSRLATLLKTFGLENRIYSKESQTLNDPIDYSKIDDIIEKKRKEVFDFLDEAFENISELKEEKATLKQHLKIERREQCCGCTACKNVCPKKCIEMEADEEGFKYPKINEDLCVNCGKCVSVCPINERKLNDIKNVYASINKDSNIRSKSSSGGTFYELCKVIINDDGVVFGCAWDENLVARHMMIDNIIDIQKLCGSKYVQSDLSNVFQQVKEQLSKGKKVLFSGTPCQVAGLKNFLGKEYDSLILVDVLCHGVPSPKLFEEYIKTKEKECASKVIDINLRDKTKSWHRLHTLLEFENGKEVSVFSGYDTYMSLFLNNISLRPSCYECKFASPARAGDISLGDFWGVGKTYYEMDDNKGTSLVLINTNKGKSLWKQLDKNFNFIESNFEVAESGNKVLSTPTVQNTNRNAFYKMFIEQGYDKAADKYANIPNKPKQLYYNLMRFGLDIYRKLKHEKY